MKRTNTKKRKETQGQENNGKGGNTKKWKEKTELDDKEQI